MDKSILMDFSRLLMKMFSIVETKFQTIIFSYKLAT